LALYSNTSSTVAQNTLAILKANPNQGTYFPDLVYEGVPQEVFLALPFTEKLPQGIVFFHEGFLANG
jgi:hypothetical protein